MTAGVCPYCRTKIGAEDGTIVCEECGTAHHADCYTENGGCTIFGCSKSPGDEPKVSVSTPELVAVATVQTRAGESHSPVPQFPDGAANSTTLSFGGYAARPADLAGIGFWPRVGARVIDFVVHYCVSFAAATFFTVLLAAASGGHIPFGVLVKLRHPGLTGFVFGTLGAFIYQVVSVSVHGSTLGKHVLSMVVVQEDGTPCRVGSAIIRELGYFFDALFFGAVGYSCMQVNLKKQRYGDQWAHTIVCKRSSVAPDLLRSDTRFALGLTLAMMADAALTIVGLLLRINS